MKINPLAPPSLSNRSVRIMRDVLVEMGIDWLPLAAAARMDPAVLEDPQGRISGANELNFQRAFVKATRDMPEIWFRTGLRYSAVTFGPLGLTAMTCETMASAIRQLLALQDLGYSAAQYRFLDEAGQLRAIEGDIHCLSREFRMFCFARDLSAATILLYDIMQHPFPLERIETPLNRPQNWREWETLLNAPVIFCAETARWVFPPGLGEQKLPMANEVLHAAYKRLCTEIIERASVNNRFLQDVSQLVPQPRGIRSAKELAREMAISERTLHRRLAAWGLTYDIVVGHYREQRSRELLKHSRLSVNQIAEQLGFAENASFSRAFKYWTGQSPLQFRKNNAVLSK